MVLGQISHITPDELTLDLPNNLTGTVRITSISANLTALLEALANGDEGVTEEDVDLKTLFYVGQYLRATITSTADEIGGNGHSKARKHIELSIDPRQTNLGISAESIPANSMIQASVVSNEDPGLVMDTGFSEMGVTGFMSSREIPQGLEHAKIKPGAVFLCLAMELGREGKLVKLSANEKKIGDIRKKNFLQDAPTVDAFLPGTAVEVLITQVSSTSIAGQVIGLLDVTADVVHSGAGTRSTDIEAKYKVGSKLKARVIFSLADSSARSVGVSVLDHILALSARTAPEGSENRSPTEILPLSATVDQANIVNVEPGLGLYVDLGVKGVLGFVHISRVADDRIESLSASTGTYRSGTSHRARVIGYNAIDGLFLASLQLSVLEQPYLRIEDIPIGKVVKGKVEKLLVNATGTAGVIVTLAQGISGLVPTTHLADGVVERPERKFKEGVAVTARVLSTDLDKRQIRLTLKKTLVNSDAKPWTDYDGISPQSQSLGTIFQVTDKGALVQFYGNVRAFLPVSEMSDSYIKDPREHFKVGQVITVRALTVDPAQDRLIISCRASSATDVAQDSAFQGIEMGTLVSGTVAEKSLDDVTIDLNNTGLRATLRLGQLTDGSDKKSRTALTKLRIGQSMQDLVVIELFAQRRSIVVSNKPSLVKAAKDNQLVKSFEDLQTGQAVSGFVRNVSSGKEVFVQFAGGLVGLLPGVQISEDLAKLPNFGLNKDSTITAKVYQIDGEKRRFTLTMKDTSETSSKTRAGQSAETKSFEAAVNPVDGTSTSIADFVVGKVTQARITSIKDTQLNVQLADNVQGRIDVSEVFSKWEDIKDRKNPLRQFRAKQTIPVRVIGTHDAKNHRFLPITHRTGRLPVYELSAKLDENASILSLDQIKVGSAQIAFVNNSTEACLWVNLSPVVRGRIERMDISEDVSLLNDLDTNFPTGSAIRVHVKGVDGTANRLDLTAKSLASTEPFSFADISAGMVVAGQVTKVTERSIMVQLSSTVSGTVPLTELADDFEQANPTNYKKYEPIRVCVVEVDKFNKKIVLSTRPSKVLSSSLEVKDTSYSAVDQLSVNDVVRGFVRNVADIGLFVNLSYNVTAFVRVSEMSDKFMKDWKSNYEVDRLVEGKVIAVDATTKQIQLSLKPSVVSKDYVPLLTFNDLSVGQVVTGKIRKVEEFGAFILVDNSHNVSGLCHRSEIAETRVEDVKKLYNEGDAVKAIVLKVEPEKRRISFGLKASYFEDDSDNDDEEDSEGGVDVDGDEDENAELDEDEDANEADAGEILDDASDQNDQAEGSEDTDMIDAPISAPQGLDAGGFDWSGNANNTRNTLSVVDTDAEEEEVKPKKKKGKSTIKIDETGTLDSRKRGASDYERLLLGQRNSSALWIEYMAFRMELSELDEARRVAERALKEIMQSEQDEKERVWIAYLALENRFGSDDSVEAVFKRACEVADDQTMHLKLADIYSDPGFPKYEVRPKRKKEKKHPPLRYNSMQTFVN